MTRIAIVGMACRYPDATSPAQLWENAVAGRRAFRRLPDVRMRLDDYWDPDPSAPDRFYARNAAVLEGYQFDRVRFAVAGSTYRSTDLTHWLALDVASQALADAGFPLAEGLPRERTGVVVGNTLTGEFARANLMRLRWPYVRRVVAASLRAEGWDDDRLSMFLGGLEASYKSPFPAIDEDSLAGGLSNTIAGRICNYFDLKGGGYTVDGACSSSLLSVTTACNRLIDGDLDVAVAGGVDLSIDPFEIIGFAKTGALATAEMRLYDRGSNGFWPGEGCGMVVLMREDDAQQAGRRTYATIAGFGISSDGKGGITRPEVSGYQLALRRAYARAGFGMDTVALFEGHGTGTAVGDATELSALAGARRTAGGRGIPAAISSIKAMIGHTKAAAGVAGLIKATMAVHDKVLPPTIGCVEPHDLLTGEDPQLRVLRKAEAWPARAPVRAGITAMGFGGINTHVVLENRRSRKRMDARMRTMASSLQDSELLLVDAASRDDLSAQLNRLIEFVPTLAYAQLADLAAVLHGQLSGGAYRAAVVVSSPEDAQHRLRALRDRVEAGETSLVGVDGGAFLGHVLSPGRIGYLFPGQGSGRGTSGGAMRRRFAEADAVYADARLPTGGDMVATEVAQPRIVTGSLAGLQVLGALGLQAAVAVGHSLGEISALRWAGAMDDDTLLRVARTRGSVMSRHSSSGTMASIAAPPEQVTTLTAELPVVIGGYNSPQQTVVAGPVDAVDEVCDRAQASGVGATRLNVSHAFHSPLVAPAADALRTALSGERFAAIAGRVISTVTGEALEAGTDVLGLLHRQITDPVLFRQALTAAAKEVDLFVEVGPGRALSGLAAATDVPAVALDTDDESIAGVLRVVAAAYVVGSAPVHPLLFRGRLVRPLTIGQEFSFLASPCEAAPAIDVAQARPAVVSAADGEPRERPGGSTVDLLRRLAAERAELPVDLVGEDSRLLDDLHLSSITVGQIVNQVAVALGASAHTPTNFATATVRELAEALEVLAGSGRGADASSTVVTGAAAWARPWRLDLDELPLVPRGTADVQGARETECAWEVYAEPGHRLVKPLSSALRRAGVGGGVLVCLTTDADEGQVVLALRGAQAALAATAGDRFVLVQHGPGAAGLAKTLHLEAPRLRVTIVEVPATAAVAAAVGWIAAEVAATTGFVEAHYDRAGTRRVPTLRVLPFEPSRPVAPLHADDVLLVTGGGKGITAECALAMATDSGARLALLGRADPDDDAELAANLRRMAAAGVTVRYARADVTDADAVRQAVSTVEGELGPVTAVVHGAGRNEPAGLASLDPEAVYRTFAPKIDGLRAVLAAVDQDRLRLLVTLGSIIGRAGLRGEAHYAAANEHLAALTAAYGEAHPHCRSLCLEWSVWSGAGMGERLAVVESLTRDGVTPITLESGTAILRRLLADADIPGTVVISGRTEGIDTIRYDLPELPLLRFIERPLIRYHGVELVAEVSLSAGTDLYLADHLLDGNQLFPAVFGTEAMAQVAVAITGSTCPPVIEEAQFLRPIVVPPHGTTRIRVAAVQTDVDTVDAVIYSEETGFAAEHFRARLRLSTGSDRKLPAGPPDQVADGTPAVPLDPATDLYGPVLFQGGRFQRLRRYHRVAARHVDADVVADPTTHWFAGFLPGQLLLGDPGVRDALMHGNQVCVPDATLLPAGIERIVSAGTTMSSATGLRFCATERSRNADTYIYDIALRDGAGTVIERWDGLRLQAVRKGDGRGPWSAPLLGPYLERAVGDLLGVPLSVAVEPDGEAPRDHGGEALRGLDGEALPTGTALAATRAAGMPVEVSYRTDGRPELGGDRVLSFAHAEGIALCVIGTGTVGCGLEVVEPRTATAWQSLLGPHTALATLVAAETGDDPDTAATRVWTAVSCLHKARLPVRGPLTMQPRSSGAWTVFAAGAARVAVLVTTVKGVKEPMVFAILLETGR
jgi:enediyne polyketide synthase